jgi:hypothetical protein
MAEWTINLENAEVHALRGSVSGSHEQSQLVAGRQRV